ncbi:hypothetical protein ABPG72_010455 [Tetrahymena utriculariae]
MYDTYLQRAKQMEKVDSILTQIIIKISSSYVSLISNFTLIILQKRRDENQYQINIILANIVFFIIYISYCVMEYSIIQNSQKELIDIKPIYVLTLQKASSKAIETSTLSQIQEDLNKKNIYFYIVGYTILFVFAVFFFNSSHLETQHQLIVLFSFFGHLLVLLKNILKAIYFLLRSAFNRFSEKNLFSGFKYKLSNLFFRNINIQQAEDCENVQSPVIKQLSMSQIINQECIICLDKLQTGQIVSIITECQHYYHQECIDNWFQCNKTCPLCRNQIFIM